LKTKFIVIGQFDSRKLQLARKIGQRDIIRVVKILVLFLSRMSEEMNPKGGDSKVRGRIGGVHKNDNTREERLALVRINVDCLVSALEEERLSAKRLRQENASLRSYWRSRDIIASCQVSSELIDCFENLVFENLSLRNEVGERRKMGGEAEEEEKEETSEGEKSEILRHQMTKLIGENEAIRSNLLVAEGRVSELEAKVQRLIADNQMERRLKGEERKEKSGLVEKLSEMDTKFQSATNTIESERILRLNYAERCTALKSELKEMQIAESEMHSTIARERKKAEEEKRAIRTKVKIAINAAVKAAEKVQARNEELERKQTNFAQKKNAEVADILIKKEEEIEELRKNIMEFERLGEEAKVAASEQKGCIDDLIKAQEEITAAAIMKEENGRRDWEEREQELLAKIAVFEEKERKIVKIEREKENKVTKLMGVR